MLETLGFDSLDALMDAAVPGGIRATAELDLPAGQTEDAVARELREIAAQNNPGEPMIGLGYHATITPPVIRRNVLEDPSWYTAYTPYQPEISQGRLEALINFQTVVGDLTGLPTANASLLDEGTAVGRGDDARTPREPEGDRTVRRRQRRAAADHRGGPHPRRARWASRWSWPTWPTAFPPGDALRRAAAVPRRLGPDPRPARAGRGRRRPGRQARGGRRPARAHPAGVARRARRRRGRRLVPAVRRPAVLRRAARRLHGGRCRPRAAPSRPARRRVRRRRGASGVPPGPADPRAAHPSRQGDLQHLHRPGAAGRRGVDVRRLPRPRGAAHASRAAPTGTPPCSPRRCARVASRWCTARSSTPCWPGSRAVPRTSSPRPARPGSSCVCVDADHVGISCSERTGPAQPREGARRLRRRGRRAR